MNIRLFLVLWFLCLALPQSGCVVQKEPVVVDRQEVNDFFSWDFGRVKEGELLRHDFRLKNESKKTLKIKDVGTSCGCTVSEVEKKILLPGEETLIKVQFESSGYPGAVEQFIYLHTDNLDNPIIRFIIKATVVKQ